eukprot:s137_g28.t1
MFSTQDEVLQMSLLRLATAATSWEDSTQLLTSSLDSLAKLRSKDSSMSSLSICLQHEFAASVVSLLRAGLKSASPALRSSASQLAIDALQIEETLLWPHLPALVSTVFECEASQHLLTAVARLGSKLQPALEQSDTRWLQLVVDPSRCRPLLRLLPCLDLTSAPVSVQRLKKIVLGEVTAARAALADQKPSMKVVLEAIKLNGGMEMQVEGEKFIIRMLEEVRRGKGALQSWHRLLLCLEAFTEVKHMGKLRISFWQKLLESATGPGRLAIWTALARWLQRLPSVCQEEPICGMQIVLQELGKDARNCSDTSLLVCLCYILVLCFSPCLLDGNVGDIKNLPNIEALVKSPFCRSTALLSLPSACMTSRQKAKKAKEPVKAKDCSPVPQAKEVPLPLPCALCKTVPLEGRLQCQCGAKLLALDWSILDGSLLDAWSSLRVPQFKDGKGCWLKHPEEMLQFILQLRSNLGRGDQNRPYCLLEPADSQEVSDKLMSEELRWLLAWTFLGLCSCSSRDFLVSKSQEIVAFFPLELSKNSRSAPWDASQVNCHAALLQCTDFMSKLFQEAEAAGMQLGWRKRSCEASAPPAILAQNINAVLAPLVQAVCRSDKASNGALQRLVATSMLLPVSIDSLIQKVDRNIGVQLLACYKDARVANLCQLLLQGPMKFRIRRLLSKMVPKLVIEQKMESIKELMKFLGKDFLPSFFTPLLPYVLSEVAEDNVGRIMASFKFLEKVYEHKLTINDICDAHWGTVLVRILWNSDRCAEPQRCGEAMARIQRLAEALPGKSQDSKKRGVVEKVAVAKKRRGEKSIIDVTGNECAPNIAGLTESGFLHALDILQIVISDSRENPKWQEYRQLLEDPFSSVSEVPLDVSRFLRSATVLLEIVGDQLHRFAVKMFDLLQCACALLRNADSLRCWKHFLRIGVTRLKPLLPAVVSELLQLADSLQDTDMAAFQEVQKLLSSVVHETCKYPEVLLALPPLPEHLRGSKHSVEKALAKMSIQQRIESTVKQLEMSSQAVRHAILQGLLHFLMQQRQAFKKVADLPNDVLAKLMRVLLKFLSESTSTGQLLCGQVLGALGAIDPVRFAGEVLVERHSPPKDLRSLKGDLELAKSVLEDFLAPNLTNNSAAFAAQEIFKYFQGEQKQDVFNKLSEDAKEVLNPYRSSKYQSVSEGHGSDTHFQGALADAIALLPQERKAFFEACLPATPDSHALALFLMHHVIHELIVSSPHDVHRTAKLSKLAQKLVQLVNFEGKDAPDSQETATAQAVFSLLDDLIQKKDEINAMPIRSIGDETWKKRQLERLEELCKPFSYRLVLSCAVRCGAHARALQFLEMEFVEATEGKGIDPGGCRVEEQDCELLQTIYRELGEPDGVVGAIRIGPSGRTRTELELQGKWSDMQAYYEEVASTDRRRSALCGLVDCTQAMRRFESSLKLISGIQQEMPDLAEQLRPRSVEAAWQLSSWDRLTEALQAPQDQIDTKDFQVQLGDILLQLHERNEVKLQRRLQDTTVEVAHAASLAAQDSYTRAYQHLLRLHVLSDLHWLTQKQQEPGIARNLLTRCDISRPSFSARQALLGPLKVALQDMNLQDEAKTVELAFSRLCRKHGEPVAMQHPDTSFQGTSNELRASAQLEWGKILYASGAKHDALRHMLQLSSSCPRAQLLGARWAADASLLLPRVAEAEFQQAKERLNNEAAFFHHASYLDYLLKSQISEAARSMSQSAPAVKKLRTVAHAPFDRKNLVTFTFRGYLQALQRGTKRLHFILNRLLQLAWECCEVDVQKQDMVAEFQQEAAKIPPWMWYSVLSQLISRALHPDLKKTFTDIIKNVTKEYPQQAAWHLVQLLNSTNRDDRSHRELGQDIVSDVGRQKHDLHILLTTRRKIAEDFGKLASTMGESISIHFARDFPRLVGNGTQAETWQILVPLQSQMTATIPRLDGSALRDANGNHFFPDVILSTRCLEQVEVFRSKEKPKKVIFLGSDGRQYPFLCKAEKRGDLRKDSRLMEFAAMVNQLLAKSPDANRRNLAVRTFHVVIISEKCGLLEWVPNTKGLRHVIDDLWKTRKHARPSLPQIKDMFDRSKDPYEIFTKQVLPRHPPVLHKWFLKCGDPSVWFAKRVLFSQSQALWSMLGYLVGLGDRHGENILLDTDSGRLVHVDFDCLFGKGLLLERPEMVPFRLTQNCVAAMGITGVEGIFRQCCEVTMEVLRDRGNTQTLLSVLHVFVADPLLEITKKVAASELAEHRVQTARYTISEVEKKLNGMLNVGAAVEPSKDNRESVLSKDERKQSALGRDRGVGLSVKGQVDELIKAATCKRNLSEMYVGWQPWL